MKIKHIFRFVFLLLIIVFLGLYFMQASGYYQGDINKKSLMTEEAILEFEQDLKEGKEINPKNYLEEAEQLDNNISNLGMSLSKLIEKAFTSSIKALFNGINSIISS